MKFFLILFLSIYFNTKIYAVQNQVLLQQADKEYQNKNFSKAKELYKKACDLNNSDGCDALGCMYTFTQLYAPAVKRDDLKAKELFEKACSLNSVSGCRHLGDAYFYGDGTQQDYSKAKELYEKVCGLSNGAGCDNLGNMYQNGKGVQKDYVKAIEFYKKACILGYSLGCEHDQNLSQKTTIQSYSAPASQQSSYVNNSHSAPIKLLAYLILGGFIYLYLYSKYKKRPNQQHNYNNSNSDNTNHTKQPTWCEILDVSESATIEEIKSAYRQKIVLYHPDKVANLGPELQEIAEKKSKEINSAYELALKLKGV